MSSENIFEIVNGLPVRRVTHFDACILTGTGKKSGKEYWAYQGKETPYEDGFGQMRFFATKAIKDRFVESPIPYRAVVSTILNLKGEVVDIEVIEGDTSDCRVHELKAKAKGNDTSKDASSNGKTHGVPC